MAETKARFIAGNFTTAGKPSDVTGATGSSQGMAVYSTVDNLPTTNLTSGDQAYVSSSNRLYISNGSGWYNVALINASPSLTISPSGTVTLAIDGSTPTVITLTGADSDTANQNLTYSVESDGSFANIATLSQDSSVFTITPLSEAASTPGTSTLTFKVSDGIAFGSGTTQFSLTFGPDWTQSPTQQAKLVASNAAGADEFGDWEMVAISGDGAYAIVGAEKTGTNRGTAYIYVRSGSTWSQQQILNAPSPTDQDYFGGSVCIDASGTYAGVGSWGEDKFYIYIRSGSTWSLQQEIAGPYRVSSGYSDYFGKHCCITPDGTRLCVGAATNPTGGTNKGAVYVYSRSGTTWSQEAFLQASVTTNQFGRSIDISDDGDYILSGSPFEGAGAVEYAGSGFIFTRSGTTWSQQAQLTASDRASNDTMGQSCALNSDGSYAYIGARGDNSNVGSAYVFTRSGTTWSQQAKLTASDGAGGDRFGWAGDMSRDANYIVVGGNSAINNAYVYERSGTSWTQRQILASSDLASNDGFGRVVSISTDGSYVIVGAHQEDGDGSTNSSGSAYIFKA